MNRQTEIEMEIFTVTEEHIKLIQKMCVYFDDTAEFGAPRIDPKRPYGNGDVYGDMCEILGKQKPDFDNDEYYSDSDILYFDKLHKEMTAVLAILIQHLSLRKGDYKESEYEYGKWTYLNDQ